MTITTLILLLATRILAVTPVDNCTRKIDSDHPITSCCELVPKQFFTFSRHAAQDTANTGVHLLNNFCGDDCTQAEAYCDTSNGGGGWIVVQRRLNKSSVDFNRTWVEYEDGFGNLTGEFWYGLKALHCLTGQGGWEMRMDITLANGTKIVLQYEQFEVASAKDKYKLTVGGFQGTTTDPMATHNKMYFTTKDSDNDLNSNNCALAYGPDDPIGGWWYKACWPNGIAPNYANSNGRHDEVFLNNQWHTLSFIEIKIRSHNCSI